MVSTARHRYAGRDMRPGEQFDADELDVPKLTAARRATRVAKPDDGSFYERRDMRAKR
jgi:hypothetical protein